jgi:hypothetical protein
MAILENPKFGKARKSIGDVVFSSYWGKIIMRSKPIEVKNPRTPAQLLTRGRHTKVLQLVKQVLVYINNAYAGSVKGRSTYNHVMSINLKNCFMGNTTSIDPSLFMLCDNDGSFVANVVLTSTVANTITGTFDSNAQITNEGADPVKAYGFYADGNEIWQFGQSATRSTGTIELTRPEMSGLNIAVYLECLDRVNLINEKPKHVIKYVGTVTVI